MAHLTVSQRVPLRKSFMPSRRHSLHFGPMNRDMAVLLDPALLLGAAAVVRQRRHVLDRADVETRRLQGTDRALTARTGTLDAHVDLAHAELARLGGALLRGALRG